MSNELKKIVSSRSGPKMLLLLLAGAGILIALVLIGLGAFLWFKTDLSAEVSTPTLLPAATSTVDRSTPLPGVVVIAPSRTPTPTATLVEQTGDSALTPTVTRSPTMTPTLAFRPQRTRQVSVDGTIELIAPDDNIQVSDSVEFKWRWLDDKECLDPPEGYAFEIRVWSDNNLAPPQGAMNAAAQKGSITCDPGSGIRSFTIDGIKNVPGFKGFSEGRFRWDVTLVQLEPYEPKISSQFRVFYID